MSGLAQLLLEVNVSEIFGDFHITDVNLGGGDGKFLACSTQRNSTEEQT